MGIIIDILEYARKRLDEAIKDSNANDINYWKGYIDAVNRFRDTKEDT